MKSSCRGERMGIEPGPFGLLAGMKDVEAVESSNYHTRLAVQQAEEETQRSIRQSNQDAQYRSDRDKREFCSGKGACNSSCGGLPSSAQFRCFDSCRSKYSMCN